MNVICVAGQEVYSVHTDNTCTLILTCEIYYTIQSVIKKCEKIWARVPHTKARKNMSISTRHWKRLIF
jgi:hypothetical protein